MKRLIFLASLLILLSGCKKDQRSGDAQILNFSVADLSRHSFKLDSVILDEPGHTIYLLFDNRIPSDSLPINIIPDISLPPGAKSDPASGEIFTLTSIDERGVYTVTAENGNQIKYFVQLRDNQIPNSGFEDWYNTKGLNGRSFREPGLSEETTVWATANSATSIYDVYGTTSLMNENNTLVKISTGETSAIPITSGTLFTGKFDINGAISNPTDPKRATQFGVPFTLRPLAFKFRYSYRPGERYIKATLKNPSNIFGGFTIEDLNGTDKFTAYSILETQDDDIVFEIARAEVISGEIQTDLKEVIVPFNYSSSLKPTRITIVFASSKDGDLYTGAKGSTLTIDDLELVYE